MVRIVLKLVIKDFSIQRKTIIRYITSALLLSVCFWATNMKQMSFSIAMFPLIYGFMNGALYEDEKNNTLRLIAALPIKKEMVVYARYISVALVTIGTGIIFMLLNYFVLSNFMANGDNSVKSSNLVIALVLLVFMVLVSFYLPMAFKMGYIKAAGVNRFVILGLFGAFAGAAAVIGSLGEEGKTPQFLARIVGVLKNTSSTAITIIFVLGVLLIYIVSMKLSVKFFKARNIF